jgi:hypothetical protein
MDFNEDELPLEQNNNLDKDEFINAMNDMTAPWTGNTR